MSNNLMYGGLIIPSGFTTFDATFSNRQNMIDNAASVFVGRYALISYTDYPLSIEEKLALEMRLNGKTPVGFYNNISIESPRYADYLKNFDKDNTSTSGYRISYDKTVWQRVANAETPWKLVANLNSYTATNVQGFTGNEQVLYNATNAEQIKEDGQAVFYNALGTRFSIKYMGNSNIYNDITSKGYNGSLSQEQKDFIISEQSNPTYGDGERKYIALLNKNDHVFSYMDATDFLKDAFLEQVAYKDNELTFTFKTEFGTSKTAIPLPIITNGNNAISVTQNEGEASKVSLVLGENTTENPNYIEITDAGLRTTNALQNTLVTHTNTLNKHDNSFEHLRDDNVVDTKPSVKVTYGYYITNKNGIVMETREGFDKKCEYGTYIIPYAKYKFTDGTYRFRVIDSQNNIVNNKAMNLTINKNSTSSKLSFKNTFGTNQSMENEVFVSPLPNENTSISLSNTPIQFLPPSTNEIEYHIVGRFDFDKSKMNKPYNNIGELRESGYTPNMITYTSSDYLSGYYEGCYFGGIPEYIDNVTINSSLIRDLNASKESYTTGKEINFTIGKGTKTIIVACPESQNGPKEVLNATVNAPMTSLYGDSNYQLVEVASANGYNATRKYKVWTFSTETEYKQSTNFKIILN